VKAAKLLGVDRGTLLVGNGKSNPTIKTVSFYYVFRQSIAIKWKECLHFGGINGGWVVLGRYHWWELNKYSSRKASQRYYAICLQQREDEEKTHLVSVWARMKSLSCAWWGWWRARIPEISCAITRINHPTAERNFEDQSGDCWGRAPKAKIQPLNGMDPVLLDGWMRSRTAIQEHAVLSYGWASDYYTFMATNMEFA